MKIQKKKVLASWIFLFESVDSGQKVPFYFIFSFCYFPFTILTQKVWTGGQVMEILKQIVSTSGIFLFESVDMPTRRCLSISYFLSSMHPSQFCQKSVDRWTSNENYEKKL